MVEIFGRGLDSRRGGRKVHMRSLAKLDPHHDHWASLLAAALVRKWHDTCSFSVIGRRHLEAALSGDRPMLPADPRAVRYPKWCRTRAIHSPSRLRLTMSMPLRSRKK